MQHIGANRSQNISSSTGGRCHSQMTAATILPRLSALFREKRKTVDLPSEKRCDCTCKQKIMAYPTTEVTTRQLKAGGWKALLTQAFKRQALKSPRIVGIRRPRHHVHTHTYWSRVVATFWGLHTFSYFHHRPSYVVFYGAGKLRLAQRPEEMQVCKVV